MAIVWRDATIPMHPDMTVWPGDPPFEFEPLNRIAQGGSCNTSRVACGTHCGTHVDAPWHFEPDGARLDAVDPQLFFGEALLIDVPAAEHVAAADLPAEPLPERVLVRTRNAAFTPEMPFQPGFAALDESAAQRLVDDGVKLVGVDYLSVAPYKQPGQGTHHRLLGAGVLVVEGLLLAGFEPGPHPFVVLPLALAGADGAPCRAFVGIEGA